ncbi:alpha-methylacyl-CoA racemase-like isoform X2 [Varroa jacobsoni]|uniref:alpha-methylacyl-CoA racemase-like isoform X2 n=1 Tax=Varroa jacobsoni TaxID=62625 RepID=UPI000BFA2746|nr:alpha-methylacyl-CoA racemase-like isoform X2 [Varroa jacobsoni]
MQVVLQPISRRAVVDRMARGKRSIGIDLKQQRGRELLKKLADRSDVLIDPYRPGVLEGMGLGPIELFKTNPGLVVARITGYGQDGPLSKVAGHDINYVATSGVLSMLGKSKAPPFPPVNLLADFAGGGLLTAMGVCAALFERSKSGKGQVVDTSMTEGTAYISAFLWRTRCSEGGVPIWFTERGSNLLDGGVHFYQTYETSDGKYMAVGALEPQFYAEFVKGLGKNPDEFPQMQNMDEAKEEVSKIFKAKTQAEWTAIFKDTDACVTPVIDFEEVAENELHKARGTFVKYGGALAPMPSPRLSRTPAQLSKLCDPKIGEHTLEILEELGISQAETDSLIKDNVVNLTKAKI